MSQGLSFQKTKHSGFVFAIHIYQGIVGTKTKPIKQETHSQHAHIDKRQFQYT